VSRITTLWYRFLGWLLRRRRDALIQVELLGSLDGPVRRVEEVHGTIVVFTQHSAYRVWYDYNYIGLRMRRVAP
jgi:hypothetical protein